MVTSTEKVVASRPDLKRARLAALSNLVKSKKPGHLEKYYQLLTDFNFLAEKINHPEFGVQALIADYDLIDDPPHLPLPRGENVCLTPEKVKTLKLIQGALRLSAHILAEDKTQLAAQMWGRLQCVEVQEIQALLKQAIQNKTSWLRPLTPSFTPPGGRLLRTLTGHRGSVTALAMTPDGKLVISGSDDKTLKVWSLETGTELFTLNGHSKSVNAVVVTPDSKLVISGSDDKTLKVWSLETRAELFTLTGHHGSVRALAVTPDGKLVISGSGNMRNPFASTENIFDELLSFFNGSTENTLKVWNLETGAELFTLPGHSESVNALIATPDGKQVISGSSDKTLKVWNLETGVELFTLTGHSNWVNAVAVTPDGKQVISGSSDKTLKVWNLETGKKLFTLTGHSGLVNAVVVAPDSKQIISGSSDKTLKVWSLEAGADALTFTGHGSSLNAVAVTSDGKRVIFGDDYTLKIWDLEAKNKLFSLRGKANALAVTPDSKLVIAASGNKTLKVWDLETKKKLFTCKGHDSYVNSVGFNPDKKRIISGSDDGTFKVWNLKMGSELFTLTNSNPDKNVRVRPLAATPNGLQVIFVLDDFESKNNTVEVWNIETREKLLTFTAHDSDTVTATVTPDGKQMISTANNRTLKVWSLKTGKELFTLTGHSSKVNAIAVTPDGLRMVSASYDRTLKVWDLSNRKIITSFTGESALTCCAVAPDGVTIVAGEASGRVHFLRLEGMEALP